MFGKSGDQPRDQAVGKLGLDRRDARQRSAARDLEPGAVIGCERA